MNIIFLLNSTYPMYTGGRETWIYNVSNILCRDNDIYILTQCPISNYVGHEDDKYNYKNINDRISIIPSRDLRNSIITRWMLHSYLNCINSFVSMQMMKFSLKKLLKRNNEKKYFVISMDTIYTGRIGKWAKKKYKNAVFINSVRGPHAEILGKRYPLLANYFMMIENSTLRQANQIWSNGWDTEKALEKRGFSSIVIKNGVDYARKDINVSIPDWFFSKGTNYHILTIGTLLDIKGYNELIIAISILKHKYGINASLTAFGKGNPSKYMLLAEENNVMSQVVFAGNVDNTVEYAKHFDIIACLSGGSGLSMACIESLLSGVPVIAWDSPVYRQMIVHKKNGYLVPEKNVIELADGLYWMISHYIEAKEYGKEAQKTVERFDWKEVVDDIIMHLEKGGK